MQDSKQIDELFRLMDEDRYLAQGKEALWFELGGMRCAAAICYDIRFCELIRKLAVGGAEALFVSAEWPLPRREHWVTLLRAGHRKPDVCGGLQPLRRHRTGGVRREVPDRRA